MSTSSSPAGRGAMGPNNSLPTRLVRAYAGLLRDFAKDHRRITLDLLVTVCSHIGYAVWGRPAQPGDTHLIMGILVMVGYADVPVGAARVFIRERRRGR